MHWTEMKKDVRVWLSGLFLFLFCLRFVCVAGYIFNCELVILFSKSDSFIVPLLATNKRTYSKIKTPSSRQRVSKSRGGRCLPCSQCLYHWLWCLLSGVSWPPGWQESLSVWQELERQYSPSRWSYRMSADDVIKAHVKALKEGRSVLKLDA